MGTNETSEAQKEPIEVGDTIIALTDGCRGTAPYKIGNTTLKWYKGDKALVTRILSDYEVIVQINEGVCAINIKDFKLCPKNVIKKYIPSTCTNIDSLEEQLACANKLSKIWIENLYTNQAEIRKNKENMVAAIADLDAQSIEDVASSLISLAKNRKNIVERVNSIRIVIQSLEDSIKLRR